LQLLIIINYSDNNNLISLLTILSLYNYVVLIKDVNLD